ncbi:TonB family protein [Archangium sp.]|uniref:TonB family protein n=1 Tax=Archangium sp. TaxID=1872627 RepID=UPI00286BD921|nr:TonB family protein [Archangium sp.]
MLSAVLHVGVFGLAVWRSMPPPQEHGEVMKVRLIPAMAAPPMAGEPSLPPRSALQKTPPPRTRRPGVKKPDVVVQSKKPSQQKQPPEVEPEPNTGEELEHGVGGSGALDGVMGGVVGGTVGGVPGGQVGGTGTGAIPFGAGMTLPKKLSGPPPRYTREALAARVEGVMIVRCVITTQGRIEQCRVIKPLPHMEQAVLEALYAQRYQPVTSQGRPIPVDYTFNIRLTLPR